MDNEEARLKLTKDGVEVLATSYSSSSRGITLKGGDRCEQATGENRRSMSMTFGREGSQRVYDTHDNDGVYRDTKMELDLDEKDMEVVLKDGQTYACKKIRFPLENQFLNIEVLNNIEKWMQIELLHDEDGDGLYL